MLTDPEPTRFARRQDPPAPRHSPDLMAQPALGERWTPTVGVVIPVLDEERHIGDCLASVFAQTYPPNLIEIVVADGGSRDRTREIVLGLTALHPNLRVIDNPARNQAAGLNRAIAATHSDVVARLDGHSAWDAEHLRRCVDLLSKTGADNVGGRMSAIGETPVASAVALASSSRLGVGGARFHYATRTRETDTVFLGCFRRSALDRVGPFNEIYPPHEDYELNYRIRATGGRIVYSPEIATVYWARTGWRRLALQYFRYGRAKARVARCSPGVIRPYHLAPPTLVLSLLPVAASLRGRKGRKTTAVLATIYFGTCTAVGVRVSRGASRQVRARVPLVFPVMHFSWGSGFLSGIVNPNARARG